MFREEGWFVTVMLCLRRVRARPTAYPTDNGFHILLKVYYAVRGGKLSGPLLVKSNPRCVTGYYGRKVEGFMVNFLAHVSVTAACREDCFGVMSPIVFY